MTPSSASVSRQCFQRTGLLSWAESRLDHVCARVVGEGVDVRHHRHLGVAGFASAIALRSRSRAGTMNGVWNAPLTCSGITFLAPSSLATLPAAATPSGGPGDDDLPGCVEVGHPDVAVGPSAGDLDQVVVEAQHRGHRARVVEAGLVHRVGTLAHQPHSVFEAECAGGRERRVLAEAVSGAVARLDAEPLDRVEHHQARHERRQLSVAGVAELLRVGVQQQAGDIALGIRRRFLDELPALVIDPGAPHARPLGTLPWKGEGKHRLVFGLLVRVVPLPGKARPSGAWRVTTDR